MVAVQLPKHNAVGVPVVPATVGAGTSVANDRTRGPCGGGVKPGVVPTVDQVTMLVGSPVWLGLVVQAVPPC
jgi:hypothetical protein